jgi:hypothetical protein
MRESGRQEGKFGDRGLPIDAAHTNYAQTARLRPTRALCVANDASREPLLVPGPPLTHPVFEPATSVRPGPQQEQRGWELQLAGCRQRAEPCDTSFMCAQCMAGAATAVASATGIRAYLGAHTPSWLDQARLRRLTILLAVGAVVVSATLVG